MFHYEHRDHPLLPRLAFQRRLVRHFIGAFGFIAGSLGVGMAGYAWFEDLGWVDAFLIVFAPILHRLMHRFHWDAEDP